MILTLSLFGFLIILCIIGKTITVIQFNRELKKLFSQSLNNSNKKFDYLQLLNLPEPVQRYFKNVMSEGTSYISCARLTHDGVFKTGLEKEWTKIEGEQYFITSKPGFIWKGTTALFTARDMYIVDKGRLIVSLFSILKIVDSRGPETDQGELLRWLAESVWFPTNLLPNENLSWSKIDDNRAELNFHYHHLQLSYIVTFSKSGEIKELETKRYMTKTELETWIVKLANYKKMNGIRIPTQAEVMWRLPKGDYPYARFNVKQLEYEVIAKF